MNALTLTVARARAHAGWLAVAALPLILAACNNGGGTGY